MKAQDCDQSQGLRKIGFHAWSNRAAKESLAFQPCHLQVCNHSVLPRYLLLILSELGRGFQH